jgi:uncharacterized membrane protein YdbT with pleckstrin-like domain
LLGRLFLFGLIAIVLLAAGVYLAISVQKYVGIALLILSLIPLGFVVMRFIAWRNELYAVTNFRIVQVQGVLSRSIFDSSLSMVNDIMLTQSLFGRMLGYGTIEIITGSDVGLNKLDALKDPLGFKRAILDARNSLEDHGHHYAEPDDDQRSQLLSSLEHLRTSGVLSQSEYEKKRSQVTGGR